MISKETAVKLKEAGFYKPNIFGIRVFGQTAIQDDGVWPSLSELIEACGDEFMLTNELGEWEAWKGGISRYVRMGESGASFQSSGPSPEEAVANLWIAINKK